MRTSPAACSRRVSSSRREPWNLRRSCLPGAPLRARARNGSPAFGFCGRARRRASAMPATRRNRRWKNPRRKAPRGARRAARAEPACALPRPAPSASSPSWNGPNDTRISRVTVEAEMAEHVAHLAVLALADRKGEPEVRALHAVERGFDGAVVDAADRDAARARRRAAAASPCHGRARDSGAASRSPAVRVRGRARRRWSGATGLRC